MILQGLIGQLNNHKVNYLHNLQTITIDLYESWFSARSKVRDTFSHGSLREVKLGTLLGHSHQQSYKYHDLTILHNVSHTFE